MQGLELTHTLSFGLDIRQGSSENLLAGSLEARRVRNEVHRLDTAGREWNDIHETVVDNANHVKNTTQLSSRKRSKKSKRISTTQTTTGGDHARTFTNRIRCG